ncbi:MAG TPA: glycoside hydrolase family 38 C-terminal domain-containing protein [Phototrophicaceae bacterium]|nr:glycoside hydrolase family 38 C-terminal domain-containing protein [Phototrophicaceae bacterium]
MSHQLRWTSQKIAQRLTLIEPLVYRQQNPLPAFRYKTLASPQEMPPIGADVDDSAWEMIPPKSYWGTWWTDFIMRTQFQVPPTWEAGQPVALSLPLGESGDFSHPEVLAYIDGTPYASADRHHHEILIPAQYCDGQPHRLALHGWTGLGGFETGDLDTKLYMRECAVVQLDLPTREFVAAARIALDVAQHLDENDPIKGRLYNALDAAFKVLDTRDPLGTPAFYQSVPAALATLKTVVAAAGEPLDVDIIGVGHAHIDVAWLWTLGQTVHKSGRTFSNVLRLMEQFPDYKFSQSQAQLYQYTERNYPDIFAQIKQRVAEGRWEPMGGTWVEPDCNATGAEALVRQFLLGRGYFRRHFGDVDTPVLWLPDTFGYSWALPQLIKQAGMKYFITHKMSWNQYNQMPNQILWWQGLDGTRVLTHFLTTPSGSEYLPYSTTYNGMISAAEILGTWKNFRQKETHNELITAYGYGDGGGGPTREMLENVDQLRQHPGAPRVRPGTIREFMERIETEIAADLPVWNGEFYLEYHRGTYTSQGRNKRANRKSELLLHDAEFLAAWAALATGAPYPHDAVTQAWELICLNQFHDILPGSSVGPVYADSAKDYETIRQLGEQVRTEALDALAQTLPANTTIVAANTLSFGGTRVGLLAENLKAGTQFIDAQGRTLRTQLVSGGTLVEVPELQPYSLTALREGSGQSAGTTTSLISATQDEERIILENALLRVEINAAGDVSRIWDKQVEREVLPPDTIGNTLLAFEDRPMNFDAWDIDIFYEDRTEKVGGVEKITITETGPVRVAVEIQRRYRSSRIDQTIYLYRDSRRIDFDTRIDWHEQHILLKAAFPVNVMSPTATFDVQWGNVQRPTHKNTPWDMARFETCAHKWADISEGNYGVALLNDCKYGYDVHDNVLRLSLVKSATNPDPQADQGEHLMTYSLLPHPGDWREGVVEAAYDLNVPLLLRRIQGHPSGAGDVRSLIAVDAPNVIIETVKLAEDGNGLIVRLYENERNRGKITLTAGFAIAEAYHCNLLEENEQALAVQDNQLQLEISPYQIITLRLLQRA